jgi:hypothetical protein
LLPPQAVSLGSLLPFTRLNRRHSLTRATCQP